MGRGEGGVGAGVGRGGHLCFLLLFFKWRRSGGDWLSDSPLRVWFPILGDVSGDLVSNDCHAQRLAQPPAREQRHNCQQSPHRPAH